MLPSTKKPTRQSKKQKQQNINSSLFQNLSFCFYKKANELEKRQLKPNLKNFYITSKQMSFIPNETL